MKLKKIFFVMFFLVIILGQQVKAYQPRFSSFDIEWLKSAVEDIMPEGWAKFWMEVETLDSNSDKEYVIVNFGRRYPLDSMADAALQNQIYVLEVLGDELKVVWKSDIYFGHDYYWDFVDANNNGRKNINVYLEIEEEGKRVGRVRMYDWNGANTIKVYPEDNLPVIESLGMDYFDYDKDGNEEIRMRKDKKEYYYLFKDGQMILKKVEEITPPNFPSIKPLEVQYPEITKIVADKGYGQVSAIMEYCDGKIYLVAVENKDQQTYLIFARDETGYKFWYALDDRFSSLDYSSTCEDLNFDGYFDLVLEKYSGMNEPVCSYYIITLKPSEYQLISPVNDNFHSSMWCYIKNYYLDWGTYGLKTNTYYNEQIAIQYWTWDSDIQCFVTGKIEYYDTETGRYKVEDVFLQKALENELAKRRYVLYSSVVYGDFNVDGRQDLAAIVGNPFEEIEFMDYSYALWIVSFNSDDQFQILFEWDGFCPFDCFYLGSYKRYNNEIKREVDTLIYEYSFMGNGAQSGYTVTFGYYENAFWPVYMTGFTQCSRPPADNSEESWDFEHLFATFSNFKDVPVEGEDEFWTGGEKEYYFFIPARIDQITIDGKLDTEWGRSDPVQVENPIIIYGVEHWSNAEDAGLKIRTALSSEYLYIFAEVTDDRVVWSKQPHLNQDHLEIWIDPEESLLYWDDDFDSFLYRMDKKGLFQFGIYSSGVEQYLPQEQHVSSVQSKMVQTESGFVAEIAIPLEDYGLKNIKSIMKFGFTLVFSDTDSVEKPAQDTLIATSSLNWGNAFTLGEIWLDLEYFKNYGDFNFHSVWNEQKIFHQ